jgi:hypothetical protein
MGLMGTTTVKTVVREEVANRARRRAVAKNISLSDYLRRLLERDLGMDDEVFSMGDLEKDGQIRDIFLSNPELFKKLADG